jgi:hypothetical protein
VDEIQTTGKPARKALDEGRRITAATRTAWKPSTHADEALEMSHHPGPRPVGDVLDRVISAGTKGLSALQLPSDDS